MTYDLPAGEWNKLIDLVRRSRPLVFDGRRDVPFLHPWRIAARWSEKAGAWEINVLPGVVNYLDAEWSNGSRLCDDPAPWVVIEPEKWTGIGRGFDASSGPPSPYFLARGVLPADGTRTTDDSIHTVLTGDQTAAAKARLLMSVAVELRMPRHSVTLIVERDQFGLTQLVPILRPPSFDRPRLIVSSKFETRADPSFGRMLDDAADPGYDLLPIGTLFLLSPPGEPVPSKGPPKGWEVVPQNRVFWNVSHATKYEPNLVAQQRFTLPGGLAGGVADAVFRSVLDDLAERDAEAVLFLSNVQVEGHFWSV